MGLFNEFKKFIARGNVLDLAVGVMIGAAFGKIVTSLTQSVLMPVIGWIFGDIDFTNWFILLGNIPESFSGNADNYAELKEAGVPMIGYGDFLTQLLDFLIVALVLFMLVKAVNRILDEMLEKQKETEDSAKSSEVPTDPQLDVLKEILHAVKERNPKTD
ncbi:large conductance mechanosensitive channel protein MscL [Altericroceibacterium spongiae]|uniref:Large-conductance mechanosensitive channel n=1 Tax=Altericroceibacterium spongiae TaxID=2320269 RepID=A0A420ER53_9SPHN|nr:large conductance mechanosensitive channel protein MscL [Altericroceibacterium spongiae]RKF23167.1 large conductance mechanosensitive channel protein MscL [Altericroceibacterium spongiae]